MPETPPRSFCAQTRYPSAKLLRGFAVRGDVMRSRIQMPDQRVVNIRAGAQPKNGCARRNLCDRDDLEISITDFSAGKMPFESHGKPALLRMRIGLLYGFCLRLYS